MAAALAFSIALQGFSPSQFPEAGWGVEDARMVLLPHLADHVPSLERGHPIQEIHQSAVGSRKDLSFVPLHSPDDDLCGLLGSQQLETRILLFQFRRGLFLQP